MTRRRDPGNTPASFRSDDGRPPRMTPPRFLPVLSAPEPNAGAQTYAQASGMRLALVHTGTVTFQGNSNEKRHPTRRPPVRRLRPRPPGAGSAGPGRTRTPGGGPEPRPGRFTGVSPGFPDRSSVRGRCGKDSHTRSGDLGRRPTAGGRVAGRGSCRPARRGGLERRPGEGLHTE